MNANAAVDCLLAIDTPAERRAWVLRHSPADGLALVQALKARADALLMQDPVRALAAAELAHEAAVVQGEPLAQGWADWALGNAKIYRGDYEPCVAHYAAAVATFVAHAMPLEAARLRTNLVFALTNLGRYAEALAVAAFARSDLESCDAPRYLATLEQNTGVVLRHLGRYQEALACYERAHSLFAALDDPVKMAEMDVNRAKTLENLDDFLAAERLLLAARTTFVAHDQVLTIARTDLNLGTLWARQGRYQAALDVYEQARAGFAALDNAMEVAMVDLYRATVYLALNLAPEALALAAGAQVELAARQMTREVALCLENQAGARALLGDFDAAAAFFLVAHETWVALGALAEAARLNLARANLARSHNKPTVALDLLTTATNSFTHEQMLLRLAQAHVQMGECALDLEHWDEAGEYFRTAANDLATVDTLALSSRLAFGLGRLASHRGDWQQAAEQLADAVAGVEMLQHTLLTDEFRRGFLDDKQAIYGAYVNALLALERLPEVVPVIERAKSAVLMDFLAAGAGRMAETADPAAQALWQHLQALTAAWCWHSAATGGTVLAQAQLPASPGDAGAQLHRIERESAEVWWRLQRLLAADRPQVVLQPELMRMQQALPADTVILDYFAVENKLLCCMIGCDHLHVVETFPVALPAVERALGALSFALHDAAGLDSAYVSSALAPAARANLRWLYEALLAPVMPYLDGCKRLVISAYGALHYLPFHALLEDEHYLLERYEVSYTPAASLLAARGTLAAQAPPTAPGRALIVGNSAGGMLPQVAHEVAAVAAQLAASIVLLEEAATTQALAAHGGACDLLHLATHAVFREDNPLFSYLQLADQPLRLLDLHELRLAAPLVVLSACETGSGRARGGDWVGLCRGFLAAGARALVASLWRVDDAATAELMELFYRNLAGGQPPAAALRAAQLALLARRPHPYYWAPFVYVGL